MTNFLRNNHKKGFTLLELLVVIGVIGVLSTIILVGLNSARQKARDAKRMQELRQVALALEMYYSIYEYYPQIAIDSGLENFASEPEGNIVFPKLIEEVHASAGPPALTMSCSAAGVSGCSHTNYPASISGFFTSVPKDPINDTTHYYRFIAATANPNSTGYCLIASQLESKGVSFYVSNKSIGTATTVIYTCPSWP